MRDRYCPLCERPMSTMLCPDDGVETLDVAPPASNAPDPEVGAVIAGRYRIERQLGQGGMGTVFLATQLSMKRTVAIKLLSRELHLDAREFKRFYQEARAASALNHPNIVRVFDFGIDSASRLPFIAMEYLEGRTLRVLLDEEKKLDERRASSLLAPVVQALVEAHAKGIVHRDLKPENVMITPLPDGGEHVRVLDFGIAKILAPRERGEASLTASGAPIGTPLYMSPEQVLLDPLDFRSDLYSVGCLLHELLTGKPPFTGDGVVELLYKHANHPRPPLDETLAGGAAPSAALVALHRALLARSPAERPATTAEVARTLSELARGDARAPVTFGTETSIAGAQPPRRPARLSRRVAPLGIALAIVVAAAGAVLHAQSSVEADAAKPGAAVPSALPATPRTSTEAAAPARPAEPAPRPRQTRLIRTTPPGAEVIAGGVSKGKTPLVVELTEKSPDGHGAIDVELVLRGHKRTRRVVLDTEPEEVVFILERTAAGPPAKDPRWDLAPR